MDEIEQAIKILKEGGIVIFPTDTAYGIGCRLDSVSAVERLFEIRKRPKAQAVPVLVSSIEMAQDYFLSPLPNNVRQLMEVYWPGGLTIVYPCKISKVSPLIRGNGKNLGLRIPDYEVPIKLITGTGMPILGPSANFHGEKTPFKFMDLDPELIKLADYLIYGECKKNKSSTVIDCSVSPFKILREGAVKIDRKYLI